MNSLHVLDASAVLCLVLNEPGSEKVQRMLPTAAISAINLSEVASKLSDKSMPHTAIEAMLGSFDFRVEPLTVELAFETARLREVTRSAGLSLADRACFATARHLGGKAVMADRIWASIQEASGVEIELVR